MMIAGVDIGKEICDALGLKADHVKSVVIRIVSDDVVRAEITQYVYREEMEGMIEVLKHYHLEEGDGNVTNKNDDYPPMALYPPTLNDIASLKRYRTEVFHLSLRQLGKLSGVSISTISRIERGRDCSMESYSKLTDALWNLYNDKNKKS